MDAVLEPCDEEQVGHGLSPSPWLRPEGSEMVLRVLALFTLDLRLHQVRRRRDFLLDRRERHERREPAAAGGSPGTGDVAGNGTLLGRW